MEAIDVWKLYDSFTVVQAALVIAEANPAIYQGDILNLDILDRPKFFDSVFDALKNAIIDGKLKAVIRLDSRTECRGEYRNYANADEYARPWPLSFGDMSEGTYEENDVFLKKEPNWRETTISREDLVEWLFRKNIKPRFFFEQQTNNSPDSPPSYLDKNHPHYSSKLAAAVRAWEAVTADPKYLNNGKTAKTNIANWLTSHAGEFGLVKEDGEINADAIKNQIAKVANWQTDGGAPKTPGG